MEFGRVSKPELVDFTLPETSPLSKQTLDSFKKPGTPKVYIGCPVWADKGFVGKVFPPKTPAKNYLREYCKQFNAIEVNATHYQIPTPETIQRWKEAASPGFKFCPKFPQHISHRNDFHQKEEWIDLFLTSIHGLGEHLGTSFIQFPPYFKPEKIKQLDQFFQKLPQDMSFAVEMRHEDWFENESVQKEWFSLLQHHNITPLITDTSGRRDVLHQMVTNPTIMIRFVGNNLHPTDFQRIDDWVLRLQGWMNAGVSEVYFFIHEPHKPFCADIARYMVAKMKDKGSFELKSPRNYEEVMGTLF